MAVELIPISNRIWNEKYRLKRPDGEPIDVTVEDTWRRVARALAAPEQVPSEWEPRFYDAMENFRFIPAGRILAGAGTERSVTQINCFVMSTIPDSLDGIFTNLREAALTMQQGGGIGYDFSTLRPKGSFVKGVEADASGPLSFMDVWDAMCKTLMSAGTRRGAMMAVIRCDHPDVFEFVNAKHKRGRLTQFNMSVLVTDAFMEAVKEDRQWILHFPCEAPFSDVEPDNTRVLRARVLWDAIMRSTYDHAEPGVIFIDRVNAKNNLHYCEKIYATNPCFSADTIIVTDAGGKQIKDLVGQVVNVWDGDQWVTVDNFRVTGHDQPMLNIVLQDGSSFRVTPLHDMILEDGKHQFAQELHIGDKLEPSSVEYDGTVSIRAAYLKGFLVGDGSLQRDSRPSLYLYEPKYCCKQRLIDSASEITDTIVRTNAIENLGFVEQTTDIQSSLCMTGLSVRMEELHAWCQDYKASLPKEIHCWDRRSKCEFIAGLFDADGAAMDKTNEFGYRLYSIHKNTLESIQTLLKSMGVRSKVTQMPGGTYQTQDCWRLTVAQAASIRLAKQVRFARLQDFSDRTVIYNVRSKANTIASIEPSGIDELVYCCTVPTNHRLSLGVGITTGQCGEQPLPPYGSCLLGSINLAALVKDPFTNQARIDLNDLEWLVPTAVRMMDNVYDVTKFPLPQQQEEAWLKRRIGLGVTGLADALLMCGWRYGTDAAAQITVDWMTSIEDRAYKASCELAKEKGAFPLFNRDGWMACDTFQRLPQRIRGEIAEHGMRNSHLMSVAPTGTISLFANNVSSGVEPIFAFDFKRKILQKDGVTKVEEEVSDYAISQFLRLVNNWPVEQRMALLSNLPPQFVTAQDLSPDEHLIMLAAAQSRCDTGISKTINLPESISFDDFKDVYWKAYNLGCKSCTTYRPNDITGSILSVDEPDFKAIEDAFSESAFPFDNPEASPELMAARDRVIDVIDRAVHNSPPPLDDVGGIDPALFDEKDLNKPKIDDIINAFSKATMPFLTNMWNGQKVDKENDVLVDTLPARPESLFGATYKLRWSNGITDDAYYVTVNDNDEGRPFEVFINSMNVDHQAWTTAMSRMVSAIFRRGGDVSFVTDELKMICDPKGGAWIDGHYVPSLAAAIGGVIERHMKDKKTQEDDETETIEKMTGLEPTTVHFTSEEAYIKMGGTKEGYEQNDGLVTSVHCPKCHEQTLYYSEGCAKCSSCGWSRCD